MSVLTVAQVAERFQLSEKTVRRALMRGDLEGAKFGVAWRIREAAAEAWYERNVPQVPAGRARPVAPAPRRGGRLPRLTLIEAEGT